MKSIFCVSVFAAMLISSTASAQTTAAMCIGPSGLPERATCESGGRANVSLTATRGAAHGEALCSASEATLVGGLAQRRAITVQNQGPHTVEICTSATCAGKGLVLKTGEMLTLEVGPAIPVYCLAAEADQVAGAGLRYVEVR